MRFSRLALLCVFGALCVFLTTVSAATTTWDKDDQEIFSLQAALEKTEGKEANFYKILGVPRSAAFNDLKKAYRKKSLELHPDKQGGTKEAQERFERLGLINKILRDDRRKRYDHFLTNGFPKYNPSAGGWVYSRFRPGLISVVLLLVLLSCGAQALVIHLNWKRDVRRVQILRKAALVVGLGPRYAQVLAALRQHQRASASGDGPAVPSNKASLPVIKEKKVRVPLAGFVDLPAEPNPSTATAADWDEHERAVKKAVSDAATFAAAQAQQGGQAPRTVEMLVRSAGNTLDPTARSDRDVVEVLLSDPESGDWLPFDEASTTPKPDLMRRTWVATLISNATGGGASSSASTSSDRPDEKATSSAVEAAANGTGAKRSKPGKRR
ncbi:hypothetical protein CF327_g1605 [Tilletia walkeri]|uniref:J domain-containing protein n=1 Tax=Tilletia walkeri TaxID=117179 RepID=A0A8X7N7L1_9BASI|nr:hypothetical protein CF327_g1605 [Tilletia walkeri]KAE8267818.1 hypothetical protein A4X09_0g4519 [Tilletia walkeri]